MKLTPEALFGRLPLAGPVPSQAELSPNGAYASWLRPADDDRERLELWLADTASGVLHRLLDGTEAPPDPERETDEEKSERERRRLFATGVTAYQWHPRENAILYPAHGIACLVRWPVFAAGKLEVVIRRITPSQARCNAMRFSPKGTCVSFVRQSNLYCRSLADDAETRITRDGGGTVCNGLAEFIAQEEMHRFDGHWWSPDEGRIAFARVDAGAIAETHRHEIRAAGIDIVPQRYPYAGTANAEVRLGLAELASGETQWLDWALAEDDYLARVQFAPDGALYVQAQSRDQRRLALRRFQDGQWHSVLTETASTWINLHDNLTFADDGRLLWTSERSGAMQLHVYRSDGSGGDVLDAGLGRVDRILAADDQQVWVTGWRDDPTTQHLFCVSLRDGACRQLTQGDAWHEGVVDATAGIGLAMRSDVDTPGSLHIVAADGGTGDDLSQGIIDRDHPYFPYLDRHSRPTVGHLETANGTFYYRLTEPTPFDPDQRYPVIVHVYGGPGVQRVRRNFPPLTLQLFAQAGFGVFELDNRGSANRAKAFEDVLHGRLGHAEVEDQLAGVDFLRTLPWVDGDRIGVFGHSYGGTMALKCLAAGDAFAAGVSVAPVTRWELYDTHYTERYLGTPADNPDGYEASSVLPWVASIRAPLLLMHGMADDNVLFTHTTCLMQALQDAGIQFQLMTYPGSKHALQEPSVAIHRYRCILGFFERTWACEPKPVDSTP